MVAEETDRVEGERQGLREFWDKKQIDTRRASFYRFETISSGL
jgi:hypothetical protein